ncbi:MAG TPA: ECF-type sigma factor [Candidatus Angelobacter sp.]|nr:ECF-type sigma factor [Candidatus Angelobacter sp.]
MKPPSTHEITQLLLAWSDGDQTALEELTPLVYAELRRLAERHMRRERAGHPLQTTSLVNKAYVGLVDLLRYFGGLNVEETAKVLRISPRTVMREWNLARAWLHRELYRKGSE